MMCLLEKRRRKCLDIRNRFYPEAEWPGVIYEQTVRSAGRPDRVFLEIGCGREAESLRRLSSSYHLSLGVDLEIAAVSTGSNAWKVLRADAHHLPLSDQSVDVIAMADVIEHLKDPIAVFRECARVLAPSGCLIVNTVNLWFPPIFLARALPHRMRRFLNRIATGTHEEDTFRVYYRANTAQALKDVAAKAGLQVRELQYVSHHPRYLMFSVTAYRLGILFERVIRRLERLRFFRHYLQGEFVR